MHHDELGWVLGLLGYLYVTFCIFMIARKTGTDNAWFAFVPILNVILLLAIADKPVWWILLLLVPLVNIVIVILVWMGVSAARGKPSWLGILILFPGVNLITMGYLAFSA